MKIEEIKLPTARLKFKKYNLTERQIKKYIAEYYKAYGIDKLFNKKLADVKRYGRLNESASDINSYIDTFSKLGLPDTTDVNIGDSFCVLAFDFIQMYKEIDVLGFEEPKKVVNIKLSSNGEINYIEFEDGDRFPRIGQASYTGRNVMHTAFFKTAQDLQKANVMLKLSLPADWTIDYSSFAGKVNEGPMSKALGTAAVAGAVGLAGNGAYHLSKLNDITAQQPAAKVAQAPAQQAKDLSTLQAKKGDDQMERDYQPITNSENEVILFKAAQAAGIHGIELAAFMAQMAHESAGFGDMVENNPNIKKYGSGRTAEILGNENMTDAERFIGRGFIQLTGKWNYNWMGKILGMDLTSTWSNAHKAADPHIAAKIAVAYWKKRVQPKVQDFSDVAQVTRPINAGLNGLDDREYHFYKIANNMGLDV